MKTHGFGIRTKIKSCLIDSFSTLKPKTFSQLFKRTCRYKLASKGFCLTENEKRLSSFKDKHKGQRVFIIGNGPSLNQMDLTLLKNEITFGVNGIFLNKEKMGFLPTYYVVEDILVAEDRANEINQLRGTTKFFGNYLDYCLANNEEVIWTNVAINYSEYPDFPNFSTNALRKLWVGGTVSYVNLQLAYYMGFKEVYLIGFDHNYVIPDSVKKMNATQIESTTDDPNHFDPNYFGKGYRWHDPNVERMEKALLKAKKFYEADGRKIYNATVGGKLEIYQRVDFNSLFKK